MPIIIAFCINHGILNKSCVKNSVKKLNNEINVTKLKYRYISLYLNLNQPFVRETIFLVSI